MKNQKKNNSLKEIGKKLFSADKVAIYPHTGMDGDAIGSCIALCIALRKKGVDSVVLIGEEIPENLNFLEREYCTMDTAYVEDADISICVDCGELERLGWRGEAFNKASFHICIDHHLTGQYFCDLNYIDPDAAATGEIIWKFLEENGIQVDREMAEAMYTAVITDTGNFKYSNTTPETHLIAAQLIKLGVKPDYVSQKIYESNRLQRIKIEAEAMRTLETFCNGAVARVYVSQKMLDDTGAFMNETDGIVPTARSIRGVELALFFKEKGENEIKVSMRSKQYADVAYISSQFGGGGHKRAAGCTIHADLETAMKQLTAAVIEYMEDQEKNR